MAAERQAVLDCSREVCERQAVLDCSREYSQNIIFSVAFSVAMLIDNLTKPLALRESAISIAFGTSFERTVQPTLCERAFPITHGSWQSTPTMYLRGGGGTGEASASSASYSSPSAGGRQPAGLPALDSTHGGDDEDEDDHLDASPTSMALQRTRIETVACDLLSRMHGAPHASPQVREVVRVLVACGLDDFEVAVATYICGQPPSVADLSVFILHALVEQEHDDAELLRYARWVPLFSAMLTKGGFATPLARALRSVRAEGGGSADPF